MNFLQRFRDSLAKDRQTLKTLTFRQKIRFILDYYRGYAFVLLCVCLIGFYFGEAWMQTRRETVLEGFFTNDEENLFSAKEITRDFSAYLGLSSRQQVIFDDSLYVLPGSSIDYHTASHGKIMAYVSARELDFLVTTRDLAEYYGKVFPLWDLEQLLPDHLMDLVGDQLYYVPDSDGVSRACAVSLEGSRFSKGAASSQTAPHYLMVLSYTEHQEALIQFLEYAFQDSLPAEPDR